MEAQLSQWWGMIGIVVFPIAQWIKTRFPADFPLSSVAISIAVSFAAMLGLRAALAPAMPMDVLINFVMSTQIVAQLTHASVKTTKKLNGGSK